MRRKAYTRRLKSGKVVQVRASFTGSPNRTGGKLAAERAKGKKLGLTASQINADLARYGKIAGWR